MNRIYRQIRVMIVLIMIVSGLSACGGAASEVPAQQSPADAVSTDIQPDKEKVLNMYVAYGGPDIIAEEFEKATGIKVELLTMSSGEVLTRLQAEKANPQTDIWFGGGSDVFIQAKEDGLIQAYQSPNAQNINPAFRDEEGYWTGVSLVVVGFLVNNDRLEDKGLTMPEQWSDLAAPAYQDELMASNPTTSGTAYTTVSGVLQIMGEEKGWEFLDKMYANIPYLEKSGSGPAKKALAGEYAIGIVPDPHNSLIKNPDASLSDVFPKDGVLAWPSPVAIIAGAKHPNNAKIFVDWCLSPEGQQVLMEASPRVPVSDIETIAGVPNLKALNLVAYDFRKWGAERERVVEEFNKRYPQYQ